VSAATPTGVGRCECGRLGRGRIVGEVEQGTGGGYVAVVCDDCESGAPPAQAATRSRVEAQLAKYRHGDE
jgi:hypothetical protein